MASFRPDDKLTVGIRRILPHAISLGTFFLRRTRAIITLRQIPQIILCTYGWPPNEKNHISLVSRFHRTIRPMQIRWTNVRNARTVPGPRRGHQSSKIYSSLSLVCDRLRFWSRHECLTRFRDIELSRWGGTMRTWRFVRVKVVLASVFVRRRDIRTTIEFGFDTFDVYETRSKYTERCYFTECFVMSYKENEHNGNHPEEWINGSKLFTFDQTIIAFPISLAS